ncbi:MAG: hypothetical protein E7311_05315 [Clostridiales bacterium]|nr:hypothetical protein [Clostridiales bacterium]
MNFKLIILLITILIIYIVCYLIYKIVQKIKYSAFGMIDSMFSNMIRNNMDKENTMEEIFKEQPKSVSGLTNLLEPQIKRDFPLFNKELIYSYIEKNLNMIFNSLENRKINTNSNLSLIQTLLSEQINNMINNNIQVKYKEVVFHKHAIKSYERSNGIATITFSSSLEYYYYNNLNSNKYYETNKKQTKYETKFIYIYDYSIADEKKVIDILHCPNCGAPITRTEPLFCDYCKSGIDEVELKLWKMVEYKEIEC